MIETIGSEELPIKRTRRSYTRQFKAQLVARVHEGNDSLACIAQEHHINANLLHKWVADSRNKGSLANLLPVTVSERDVTDTEAEFSFELSIAIGTFRFSRCWDPAAVAQLVRSLR